MTRLSRLPAAVLILALLTVGCGGDSSQPAVPRPALTQTPWGQTPDGQAIDLISLRNRSGIEIRIMTYGGIVLSLRTPDRDGELDDIVLGFDSPDEYFEQSPYFGAIIGRYANRIANASFPLDGETYQLTANDGANHLHGGTRGWDKVVWQSEAFQDLTGIGVVLRHVSPDGDQGYPGEVIATVTYRLTDDDELFVEYAAVADRPTVINMTHHSYFNLAGSRADDVLGHELTIAADRFIPTDAFGIPRSEIRSVFGTPFDFLEPQTIGSRLGEDEPQLVNGRGYDHTFILNSAAGDLTPAARVVEPLTGRTLEVATTEPGVQFYSGNYLDGTITGKGGRVYGHRSGFCLEPQHFPDSPNQVRFPSTVLRLGREYRSTTVFRFGVD